MKELILLFDRACAFTTGQYIDRAAKREGIEVHPGPCARSDTPLIMVDDSSEWSDDLSWIEQVPRRCFWAIDTHVAFDRILGIAEHFPLVFAAQVNGTEALKERGINAHWLPVAAEPDGWHADLGIERDIDVAFVGHARWQPRVEVLRLVEATFDNFVFDDSGDPIRISEIYSRAKTVINHSVADDLNMRIFEAASCGAVIVTNEIPPKQWGGLDIDAISYETPQCALSAIESVLADYGALERMRKKNAKLIRKRHTYRHRLKTMLRALDAMRR